MVRNNRKNNFMKRITIKQLQSFKNRGRKITMLTAYDYPSGLLADQAGMDIILVGDSLANVVLGLKKTPDVGMTEMIHHAKAVRRAVKNAFLVGDMPFEAYQTYPNEALKNARRFIKEAGCQAVKVEWFDGCEQVALRIVKAGIPVMGHVGLTPQTADKLGGFKVQGKEMASAYRIIQNAEALQKAGCFSIVLECIPAEIGKIISKRLKIPTIGIGAGKDCDGQVLVIHDLLGVFTKFHPKFVKSYAHLGTQVVHAIKKYRQEVIANKFPNKKYSYAMNKLELDQLEKHLKVGCRCYEKKAFVRGDLSQKIKSKRK